MDDLTGTTGNDTFRAFDLGAVTLQAFDTLNGGAGTDTLNIADAAFAATAAPVISNIEIINNESAGDELDLTNVTGAQQIWSEANGVYSNADTDTIFGGRSANTVTIEYAGTLDDATINLAVDSGAAVDVEFDIDDAQDGLIAEVNVLAVGDSTISLDANLDALTTINVSGEGELVFDPAVAMEATLETFNASSNSGGVTVDLSAAAALETATGGSGADDFTVVLSDDADTTIDMGAGNDELSLDGTGDTANVLTTVTLGAGNDDFILTSALSNVVTAASFEDGLITITDFNAADDVIDVSALGARDVLTNTELANIAAEDTLAKALDLAASFTTATQYSVFNYDGDAYLLNNAAGVVLSDGDGLIKISGISVADLEDGVNFIA